MAGPAGPAAPSLGTFGTARLGHALSGGNDRSLQCPEPPGIVGGASAWAVWYGCHALVPLGTAVTVNTPKSPTVRKTGQGKETVYNSVIVPAAVTFFFSARKEPCPAGPQPQCHIFRNAATGYGNPGWQDRRTPGAWNCGTHCSDRYLLSR